MTVGVLSQLAVLVSMLLGLPPRSHLSDRRHRQRPARGVSVYVTCITSLAKPIAAAVEVVVEA
jgi:hypothetical protein